MPNASLTIDGTEVIKKENGEVYLNNTNFIPPNPFTFRNKIINGDMRIDQRNAGSSYNFAHDGTTSGYTLDRFQFVLVNSDEFDCTITQYSMSSSEISATGHSNALKLLTGTTETTVGNDEYLRINQRIEGQNLQDLKHGTASAKSTVLSFWVKSSETGTYGLSLFRYVRSGSARTINLSYTIDVADTWEHKTIPITGDTGGDLIPDTNGNGLLINWQLAAGSNWTSTASSSWDDYVTTRLLGNYSNSVATTASATWYITGVQLEVGNQATPFEHRPYGVELGLCQRYYQKSYDLSEKPGGSVTYPSNGPYLGTYTGAVYVYSLYNTTYNQRLNTNIPLKTRMRSATGQTIKIYNPYNGDLNNVMQAGGGPSYATTIQKYSETAPTFSAAVTGNPYGNSVGDIYRYHWVVENEL